MRRLFFKPRSGRGPADFDLRNVLAISYIWQIPEATHLPPFAKVFANGWQYGGIYRASSGQPFTPGIAGDPLGQNSAITFDYPDKLQVPPCDKPVNRHTPSNYILTMQCFQFPTLSPSGQPRMGNVGRNSIAGPALSDFDMSLFKNNKIPRISETFNMQFRFEAFNILNRTNFAPPITNRNIFDASGNILGGGLNTTTTDARQLQFGVKVGW